jgi:L-malate glycosyltransferase
MRILYFTRDYSPHDRRFLGALAESEHEIYCLRLEQRRKLESAPLPEKVTQVKWVGGKRPVSLPRDGAMLLSGLREVIRRVKPDVIHAGPIQQPAFLTALTGFHPLVSMSWGMDLLKDANQSVISNWVAGYTLKRSDVFVGDCLAVQNKAASLGFPKERSVIFPWGVDLDWFKPAEAGQENTLRSKLGWQDQFVVLCLRSWEPVYGVDLVARAFVKAAQIHPETRLLLYGSGSEGKKIHSILEQGGVADKVYFGGQAALADLPEVYRATDLYVSASHSDGSSVSLLEAQACSKPVLVSDIAGNLEWVANDEQGWLFKDGDSDGLLQGMIKAVEHQEQLPTLGQAGRSQVEKRANWKKNFPLLLEAYEMSVNQNKIAA